MNVAMGPIIVAVFFISFCNHDLVFLNIVGTSDSNQFCFDLVSSSLVFCRR